jgi:predicted neuraminidase/lysophospholipase L1-like esterase
MDCIRIARLVFLLGLFSQCALAQTPTTAPAKFKIVLIGDSTVSTSSGWGPGFAKQLSDDAECIDLAQNGRSSKSFLLEGHWKKALALRPNVVLIQFGHNDQPGKGPERETDPATTYKDYLSIYIDESRAMGARPILVTSLSRRKWGTDGKIHSDLTPYVQAVKELAAAKHVELLDLHAASIALYEKIGKAAMNELSPKTATGEVDNTHLNPKGSEVVGEVVATELKKIDPEIAAHLKGAGTQPSAAITMSEFIFQSAPFPSCHASTIAETKHGLIAAWFGGTRERAPDVGIWVARTQGAASAHDGEKWSAPVEVANGIQEEHSAEGAASPRLPTWNPVLFQPRNGPLLLFYKVGPSPAKWWGMMMHSDDEGATWSKPTRLPDGILGPIKDKPIQLADGTIVCPSSTEDGGWRVHMEFTKDLGKTWTKSPPLNDGEKVRLIQPAILDHGNGTLQILCRSRQQKIVELHSSDSGATWSEPAETALPNPNSGIDAVQLRDGRSLVVYNHSATQRIPLDIALSTDGKIWQPPILI